MPFLDILRVFAALCVFTIHFLSYRNVPVPQFVFDFFTHCAYGVCIFFVISGFLIMQSLERSESTAQFYKKRAARIIPGYYFIIIFGIIVWDIILGQMPKDSLLHLGWARYFLFLNTLVPSNEYYFWNDLWGLWTMSCFALFYLIVPIIGKKVKSYKQSVVLLLGTFVFAYIMKLIIETVTSKIGIPSGEIFAGDSAYFNMPSFVFGVVLWYAVRENKISSYLKIVTVLLTAILLCKSDSYNRLIWSLITCILIIAFKDFKYSENFKWIGKAFKMLGGYSFTFYLVHYPIMELVIYYSDHVKYVGFTPFLFITVLGSALMAFLVNTFVEKPMAHLIDKGRRK